MQYRVTREEWRIREDDMLVREIVKGEILETRSARGGPVEVDERGLAVSRGEILRRGRIVVGLRIRAEQERDRRAGRTPRQLSTTELRCLHAVSEAEIRGSLPA